MNLARLAAEAAERGTPVRAGLIGAGKFGSMFLSQVPTIAGLEVTAIADLDPERARNACRGVGWDDARVGATAFVEDGAALAARDDVDVVIEATGNPRAGIVHAEAAISAGKHVVMVNVEAMCWWDRSWRRRHGRRGSVIPWPTGINRRLCRNWSTGRGRRAFTSRRQGKGPNTCQPITMSHRMTSGSITG
ncbi:Gfo/Idh/MocA family oxidoreductase [Marimonas sp. MJW-29]|uniref:Gfo/Idh/MocA family oxidoreductase n=1 Tax=Sulfitobacter sediminis TaxID=3234186 RepID=A0ABV3RMB3_9RHOB